MGGGFEIRNHAEHVGGRDTPLRYERARAISALFTTPIDLAISAMPSARLEPLRWLSGTGIACLFACEFEQSTIGPFREFGFGFLCSRSPWLAMPLIPAIFYRLLPAVGVCFDSMAVTSPEACAAAHQIWDLPTFLAPVIFEDHAERCVAALEIGRERVAEVTVDKQRGKPKWQRQGLRTLSVHGGDLLTGCHRTALLSTVSRGKGCAHLSSTANATAAPGALAAALAAPARVLEARYYTSLSGLFAEPFPERLQDLRTDTAWAVPRAGKPAVRRGHPSRPSLAP
ncbi:MAG: acetoacetate decarboxylase family protein [Candidatus Schekmanbacteria bacterium]|nr:acetoacetate decarboxylase family protein [Candidatus Schekmanbacteria bacterium]